MPNHVAKEALSPRKQPSQRRSAATVAAILDAAAHILEATGLVGYTTNAVAERAGVSIGSVYQYFPNRDSVTRALIERRSEDLMIALLEIDESARGRDGISELIGVAVRQQLRQARMARILDLEEDRMPTSDAMINQGKRTAEIIRIYLQQAAIPANQIGPAVGDVMAITLGMVNAAGRHGETDETGLIARICHAVFGYLDSVVR